MMKRHYHNSTRIVMVFSSCIFLNITLSRGKSNSHLSANNNVGITLKLYARKADIHSSGVLRYSQKNNCIFNWSEFSDYLTWTIEIKTAGKYVVNVCQACNTKEFMQSYGGRYQIEIRGQKLENDVENTNDWSVFKTFCIGEITIETPGQYILTVKPLKVSKLLMRLRSVTLTLAKASAGRKGSFVENNSVNGSDVKPKKKKPVPGNKAKKAAQAILQKAYGDRIRNANTINEKRKVARLLLEDANSSSSSENKFTLLVGAANIASESGDIKMVYKALHLLTDEFDTKALVLKDHVIQNIFSAVKTRNNMSIVARKAMLAVQESVSVDNYDLADKFINYAAASSKKARDADLLNEVAKIRNEIKTKAIRFQRVKPALAELEENPDDSAANITEEGYYCFVKNDWKRGIPLLAKSDKEPYLSLAQIELACPKDAETQNNLADEWWKIGEQKGGIEKVNAQIHAVKWYQKAMPGLKGMMKRIAMDRLEQYEEHVKETALSAAENNSSDSSEKLIISLPRGVIIKLVKIPAGSFIMGGSKRSVRRSRSSFPNVTISHPFYMSVTEVTQAQYILVMGKNPSEYKRANLPVTTSWVDAVIFCKKLSMAKKRIIRLPTEAEWEYACRAGTGTRFSFGDSEDELHNYANYADLTCKHPLYKEHKDKNHSDGYSYLAPVGAYKPNKWGLYDMYGNVAEWCIDWYTRNPFSRSKKELKDPKGPATGSMRVVRGAAWIDSPKYISSYSRGGCDPDYKKNYYGFRIVVPISPGSN